MTAKRYFVRKGWKKWHSMVGFRADEAHRQPYPDNRITTLTPLKNANVSKHDVALFWRKQPFDLKLPIFRGKTVGGNCDFCFKKSEAVIAAGIRDEPERPGWWLDHEANTGRTFSKRYARRDVRQFVERQGDWIFNDEHILCQVDGGEWTCRGSVPVRFSC